MTDGERSEKVGNAPCQLYRHFDGAGLLLYVGISLDTVSRLSQHRRDAEWFSRVATITVEHFPSREEAMAAERRAISSERPIFNKSLNRARYGETATLPIARPKPKRLGQPKGATEAIDDAFYRILTAKGAKVAAPKEGLPGASNPNAVMGEAEARVVIGLLMKGLTNTAIAKRCAVGHAMVSRIRVGRAWREVADAMGYEPKPSRLAPKSGRTAAKVW